ncbi:MAG TPA: SIMPL domain-containing protein [Allosphingosinicella sp.]|nr:SIMPL domain-containing protein [Allosphingosinicella sp.]
MWLVTRALALALALVAAPVAAQNAPLELRPGETLLEVDATGTQASRPDVMRVTAGIVTTGGTAREAAEANAAVARRIVEALRAGRISEADVRTSRLRISPRFERERNGSETSEPRIIGYVANNQLEVRVRDLARSTAIIDALIAAGANEVSGPYFSLADEAPARRSARRLAVAAARAEAEEYADALGMRIARVLRVSERSARAGGEPSIVVSGSRISGTPIEPGEIETQVQVWIDYALTPR